MKTFMLGDLRIDHVEEICYSEAPAHYILANLPEDAMVKNLQWMAPDFCDINTMPNNIISSVHSWVIRTPNHTVLIDTCTGNDKSRPAYLVVDHLSTPYLDRLAKLGVVPENVDYVMCTHLHLDHVGWNTRLVNDSWVPTFPNARYIFGRHEYEYRHAFSVSGEIEPGEENVFEDSVLPVVEAGQSMLVDYGYCLKVDGAEFKFEAAEGHTEGHGLIRATSRGETGLFIGDLMHTPLQVRYPDCNSIFCKFPDRARESRRRTLSECAEQGHLLLSGHWPAPHVGRVTTDGNAFKFKPGV